MSVRHTVFRSQIIVLQARIRLSPSRLKWSQEPCYHFGKKLLLELVKFLVGLFKGQRFQFQYHLHCLREILLPHLFQVIVNRNIDLMSRKKVK